MPQNYAYKIRCDRGFAPNTSFGLCSLTGCKNRKSRKKGNIEELAKKGSWVIGIGGKDTGKPNKLIYAMEVEENLLYREFKGKYPNKSQYLTQEKAGTNVLVSTKFYYFGEKDIGLSNQLEDIIIKGRGCKCVSDEDIVKLKRYIVKCGYTNYGAFGKPCNNEGLDCKCKKC